MTLKETENTIINYEEQLIRFFNTTNFAVLCSLIFVFFGAFHYWYHPGLSKLGIKFLHYPNIAVALNVFTQIIFASVVIPLLPSRKLRSFYTVFVLVLVWFYHVYISLGEKNSTPSILLSLPILAFFSYLCLTLKWSKLKKVLLFFTGFLIFMILIKTLPGDWVWFFKKKWNIYFFFIVAFIVADVKLSKESLILLVLSPSHIALPVNFPIPEKDNYELDNKEIWVRGIVNLAKAYVLITINYYLIRKFLVGGHVDLKNSWMVYLSYLLTATAVGNFVTGLARIYMVKVVNCSNLIWLSSSPLDFFKRENVHAYLFSIRFFYFNFLKLTRNLGLIVFCYFMVFPLYRNSLDLLTFDNFYTASGFWQFFGPTYLFWFILFAVIAFTYKLRFFANPSWRSWFVTHLIMLVSFHMIFSTEYSLLWLIE